VKLRQIRTVGLLLGDERAVDELEVDAAGCAWRSFPFGPCTSTAPSTILTVTPLGIVIGFLPIRDICVYQMTTRGGS